MDRERILCLIGYDPELLNRLPEEQRHVLRGSAVVWIVACVILAVAGGYAATLIQPNLGIAIAVGFGVAILTVNLLRVVNAGGGSELRRTRRGSEAAAAKYRPSLIPAVVFGVLAAMLSQPAQLPFWPELGDQVEEHRQILIEQHEIAAADLGNNAEYYREELEAAGFPIFRIKLIWKDPKRAARMTILLCLLVLLPGFWSQVISLKGHRAYEKERGRRSHDERERLGREGREQVATILGQWDSYEPPSRWQGQKGKAKNQGPWLRRSPS
jgi:hypothetical protein